MNKLMNSHASRPEARDKQEMNLSQGLCFDLTLSATEILKIFDDPRIIRPDQRRAATADDTFS
jgi:hypothetical protein